MKQSTVRSLAAIAALAPALACATSAPVTNASVTPAATTASAPAASQQSNVRTIGSVGAPIGLQLWSLRAMARTDPKAMLEFTRAQGITHVETAGLYGTVEQTAELFRNAGIRATSMHVGMDEFKKNPQKIIADAKA